MNELSYREAVLRIQDYEEQEVSISTDDGDYMFVDPGIEDSGVRVTYTPGILFDKWATKFELKSDSLYLPEHDKDWSVPVLEGDQPVLSQDHLLESSYQEHISRLEGEVIQFDDEGSSNLGILVSDVELKE